MTGLGRCSVLQRQNPQAKLHCTELSTSLSITLYTRANQVLPKSVREGYRVGYAMQTSTTNLYNCLKKHHKLQDNSCINYFSKVAKPAL